MNWLFFLTAVILLVVGNVIRTLRWQQIIETYEKTSTGNLLFSLSVGYAINFFMPFRVGDVFRALISGKKLANGFTFSFSTLVAEYFLDIPVVWAVYALLFLSIQNNDGLRASVFVYSILIFLLILVSFLAICFKNKVKALARLVTSLFNAKIEYSLLFFLWGLLTSLKDIIFKINKKRLLLNTILMWGVYLSSYYCFAESTIYFGIPSRLSDVFNMIFSRGGFSALNLSGALGIFNQSKNVNLLLVGYIFLSLVLLFMVSFIILKLSVNNNKEKSSIKTSAAELLPMITEKDRLTFLIDYFSSGDSTHLRKYVEYNRNILILQDFTAGSNATTMLASDGDRTFFRKYAVGSDGDKLYDQLRWLCDHKGTIPLPKVISSQHSKGYCIYDMEYNAAAVSMFNFIHSASTSESWKILQEAFENLSKNLHTVNLRPANDALVMQYIENKILDNVKKIEAAKEIRFFLGHEPIVINGVKYHNLPYLKKWLDKDYLYKVFSTDNYAEIHGDLTIENLICAHGVHEPPYYFIDPNTGNLHDSPMLDYSKLLQSLHGNYEFLMRTEHVEIGRDGEIKFVSLNSKAYDDIYRSYHNYLVDKFSFKDIRSIYFHEVVHWLRLMPYKINKDGKRCLLFYAGLIKIFNDVVNWYGDFDK
jgi:hypothetical protein